MVGSCPKLSVWMCVIYKLGVQQLHFRGVSNKTLQKKVFKPVQKVPATTEWKYSRSQTQYIIHRTDLYNLHGENTVSRLFMFTGKLITPLWIEFAIRHKFVGDEELVWKCRLLKHCSKCVRHRKSDESEIRPIQHAGTCQSPWKQSRSLWVRRSESSWRSGESLEKKCGCLSRQSRTANRKGSNYGTSQAFADTRACAKAPLVHPDLSHHHTLRFSVATWSHLERRPAIMD